MNCEAMIRLTDGRYSMCGRPDADLHHRLTRARGGLILDAAGETHHHMYLCREHHGVAHDQGSAFENGLLLDGYVTSGPEGPVYVGSDPYLSERYGQVHLPDLREDPTSAVPSQGL
jgi:hypothetical protein